MSIDPAARVLLVGALVASGCARIDFHPETIGVDVEIASAQTGDSPTLYRASAKGDADRTGIEYFAAFGMAADRQCAGVPYSIIKTIDDLDAPTQDGASLSMEFSCRKVTLPNHSDLPTDRFDEVFSFSEPASGLRRKQGWTTPPGHQHSVRAFNELIGGFLREAYADECGGGPMLIERVGTATEVVDTELAHARKPRVYANVDYHCVSADPSAAQTGPELLPASAMENP